MKRLVLDARGGLREETIEDELAALSDTVECDECGEEHPRRYMAHATEQTRSRKVERYLCGDCVPPPPFL